MRIYLTSVAETKNIDKIQHLIKVLFPKYSVVTIPNKYATEKGRQEIREYSKKYYEKNKEIERRKRRERYQRQKEERKREKAEMEKTKVKEESKAKKKQKNKERER